MLTVSWLAERMELSCEFLPNLSGKYECLVKDCNVTARSMVLFSGKHLKGKSNDNVMSLKFQCGTLHFLPSGLGLIFPNLMALEVYNCKLKDITAGDLEGLKHLEKLWLDNNSLSSLPDDLFINTRKLMWISLNDNQLEVVSSRLLDPIPDDQIKFVSFCRNRTVDSFFGRLHGHFGNSLKSFKTALDASCLSPVIHCKRPTMPAPTRSRHFQRKLSIFEENLETSEASGISKKKDSDDKIFGDFLKTLEPFKPDRNEILLEFDPKSKTVFEDIVLRNLTKQSMSTALKLGILSGSERIVREVNRKHCSPSEEGTMSRLRSRFNKFSSTKF